MSTFGQPFLDEPDADVDLNEQGVDNGISDNSKLVSTLRRGKWTPEEEVYANAAIRDFNNGYLDSAPGTTLRSYLSERLQCDPMRITKKYTGNASIGKKVLYASQGLTF